MVGLFSLLCYICDALRACGSLTKNPVQEQCARLNCLCLPKVCICSFCRCKRVERISALARKRLFLAFPESVSWQDIFLNVLFLLFIWYCLLDCSTALWIASAELFQLSPASLRGEMPPFGTVRHSHYGCVEDRSVHVLKFWGSTARCYSQLSTEHSYCHCVRAEQLWWKRGWISSS